MSSPPQIARPPISGVGADGIVYPIPLTAGGTGVVVTGGGGGGGAVTIADGADVAEGATTDAAVATDAAGTVNAHLRGIVKLLASCISIPSNWLQVSVQNAVLAVTQSGAWTVALSAGSALVGKVSIDQTTPGTTNLVAAGGVGVAGAAVAGNPLRSGGLGRTTLPASVSSAQLVDLLLDRYGRTYTLSPVLTTKSSAGTPIITNTNTTIVTAPSAGNHLRVHRLWAQNSSATGTWCYWGNGSGDKTVGPPFFLAQNQPFGMDIKGAWELSTATGLFMNTATTGANIEWYVEYETLTD